jgi:site-specific recombinase XerD
MESAGFISILADRFSDFVNFRRLGGVEPRNQIKQLRPFDIFLYEEGFQGAWPTPEVVDGYVATTDHLHPGTRGNRLSAVRQFCRYLRQFEPECYVPARKRALERRPRRIPHIFSEEEITALLNAASNLPPSGSMRAKTYSALFGLLYTTGMRCGEAFALNIEEVDLEQNLLYVNKGKFGKSRWVPISASTSHALERYIAERSRVAPSAPNDPVFITGGGRRLYHTNTERAFHDALKACALRDTKGCQRPRVHDLRHSYACTRVLIWYREGKDVNKLLPALATYLGHVDVTSTQVYLRATAELLEEANKRFLENFRKNVL